MVEIAIAVGAAVLLWWASTGVILFLDGLPRQTFKWSFLAVALLGVCGALAAVAVAHEQTAASAYIGFGAGLLIWAVPTAAFYFGLVTGPRQHVLAEGTVGWARFRAAVETMLYHEIFCIVGALLLAALLWSSSNQLALWTYLVLWAMHVSGKLNMYFGVANLSVEFLPPHLAHLSSYMRTRPMNLLFPLSVSLATITTAAFAALAWTAPAGSHASVGATLLTVLAALAVLEHWLLVLPVSPMALWTWSLKSRQRSVPTTSPPSQRFPKPAFEAGPRAE
jgi:putative photosynthetic complex assembly protein 2